MFFTISVRLLVATFYVSFFIKITKRNTASITIILSMKNYCTDIQHFKNFYLFEILKIHKFRLSNHSAFEIFIYDNDMNILSQLQQLVSFC